MELTPYTEAEIRHELVRLSKGFKIPQPILVLDTQHIYESRSSESNSSEQHLIAGSYYPINRVIILYMRVMESLESVFFHLYHEFKHRLQHIELGNIGFTSIVAENGDRFNILQKEADAFAREEQERNP